MSSTRAGRAAPLDQRRRWRVQDLDADQLDQLYRLVNALLAEQLQRATSAQAQPPASLNRGRRSGRSQGAPCLDILGLQVQGHMSLQLDRR